MSIIALNPCITKCLYNIIVLMIDKEISIPKYHENDLDERYYHVCSM
jgi:hypothetical protein